MKKKMTHGATTLLVLAIAGGATACSSSAGTTASASSHISSSAAAPAHQGTPILLNASDEARLKKNSSKFADIISQCNGALPYQAKPVSDLNASAHYSSTGANAPDATSKVLEADSLQAYKLALCYKISGDVKYAISGQKIIDAWSSTLKSASTTSGQDNIAFFMTPMTPAASWVRGVHGWNGNTYATFLKNVGSPTPKR